MFGKEKEGKGDAQVRGGRSAQVSVLGGRGAEDGFCWGSVFEAFANDRISAEFLFLFLRFSLSHFFVVQKRK